MGRDVKKAIERGKKYIHKRPGLDLCLPELNDLLAAFRRREEELGTYDAAFFLVSESYLMGLDVGMRNAKGAIKIEQ